MSGTDRNHHLDIPLWTRMSDVQALGSAPLQWFLTYVHEATIRDATYFALGTAVHETIEAIAQTDMSLEDALEVVSSRVDAFFSDPDQEWQATKKRPADPGILAREGRAAIERFFEEVHPYGARRFSVYDDYQWPFETEVVVFVEPQPGDVFRYPVRTEVDAVFTPKKGKVKRIVDWKSGATANSDPVQLWGYFWGLNRDEGSGFDQLTFDGHFHHLLAGASSGKLQQAPAYPGHHAIERLIAWTEQQKMLGQTEPAAAFPPIISWKCNTCRVKDHCPAFAGPEAESKLQTLLESGTINWVTEPTDSEELRNVRH